jgi:hypothetical protein
MFELFPVVVQVLILAVAFYCAMAYLLISLRLYPEWRWLRCPDVGVFGGRRGSPSDKVWSVVAPSCVVTATCSTPGGVVTHPMAYETLLESVETGEPVRLLTLSPVAPDVCVGELPSSYGMLCPVCVWDKKDEPFFRMPHVSPGLEIVRVHVVGVFSRMHTPPVLPRRPRWEFLAALLLWPTGPVWLAWRAWKLRNIRKAQRRADLCVLEPVFRSSEWTRTLTSRVGEVLSWRPLESGGWEGGVA